MTNIRPLYHGKIVDNQIFRSLVVEVGEIVVGMLLENLLIKDMVLCRYKNKRISKFYLNKSR